MRQTWKMEYVLYNQRFERQARMAKLADAADLKSADLNRSWGFKSPSGHQQEFRQKCLPSGLGFPVEDKSWQTQRTLRLIEYE